MRNKHIRRLPSDRPSALWVKAHWIIKRAKRAHRLWLRGELPKPKEIEGCLQWHRVRFIMSHDPPQ